MSDIQLLETTHQYFHSSGRELMAVTKAFELIGITDFSRVPFYRLEPARVKGDAVHEIAAYFGLKVLDEESVDAKYAGYLGAVKKFYAERVKRVIAIEEPVFDLKHGYAGTPDIIYEDPGGVICLDDFKTPLKFHPATKWQTAAYAIPAQKIHGIKIEKRHGVQLLENGDFNLDPHERPLRRDYDEFITILRAAFLKVSNKIK